MLILIIKTKWKEYRRISVRKVWNTHLEFINHRKWEFFICSKCSIFNTTNQLLATRKRPLRSCRCIGNTVRVKKTVTEGQFVALTYWQQTQNRLSIVAVMVTIVGLVHHSGGLRSIRISLVTESLRTNGKYPFGVQSLLVTVTFAVPVHT